MSSCKLFKILLQLRQIKKNTKKKKEKGRKRGGESPKYVSGSKTNGLSRLNTGLPNKRVLFSDPCRIVLGNDGQTVVGSNPIKSHVDFFFRKESPF